MLLTGAFFIAALGCLAFVNERRGRDRVATLNPAATAPI
jgi:hypothetical protein